VNGREHLFHLYYSKLVLSIHVIIQVRALNPIENALRIRVEG